MMFLLIIDLILKIKRGVSICGQSLKNRSSLVPILELFEKQPRYRGQISPYAISNLVGSKTTKGFANVRQ